uniref:Uncharacterized protein n=1 Tax=Triticum urartu TaxID=4572 RepID=A0A8R7VCK7_TRIUA
TCQLGHQPRLVFPHSSSFTTAPFQHIHYDSWTTLVVSFFGFQYYLIILDGYSHFSWSFPHRNKSDTSVVLRHFFNYVLTQFHAHIKSM